MKLAIKLVHSQPHRPEGRGKIERFFRTVNGEFTVEIASGDVDPGRQVKDLGEMNRLFMAWVENVYHRRTTRRSSTPSASTPPTSARASPSRPARPCWPNARNAAAPPSWSMTRPTC